MNEPRQHLAERRLAQTRSVRAMLDTIRALLDGHLSRAALDRWTREPREFDSPCAAAVYGSLRHFAEAKTASQLELHVYIDALERGDWFAADRRPLVRLDRSLGSLAADLEIGPSVAWWIPEHGWTDRLRFTALASGRGFEGVAVGRQVDVYKLAADPWDAALVDLFEHLAIDERDCVDLDPQIDLAELPAWALWRADDNANRFEMERFRSFAKAEACERLYTERGHKQIYWIEPVA